jgi:hypothetical protein
MVELKHCFFFFLPFRWACLWHHVTIKSIKPSSEQRIEIIEFPDAIRGYSHDIGRLAISEDRRKTSRRSTRNPAEKTISFLLEE